LERALQLRRTLPQTVTEYWKELFNSEEREVWTNSLANLTLLSMRKNIQAQNYSYEKKVQAYQDKDSVITPFLITQYVIKCEKWDVSELEKRETHLIDKIMIKLDLF
jgi:hypothetical protein